MRTHLLLAAVLAVTTACQEDPVTTTVNTGTIGGVPFTVFDGMLHQTAEDGPVLGDFTGALLVLDQSPAELGMSDGRRLHLRTTFALRHGGQIVMAAFGPNADPLGPGTGVRMGRNNARFEYVVYVTTTPFLDSLFIPADASIEHTVVTEFYADSVPGYGAGSGMAMWPLDDLTPSSGEDVVGCSRGPAMSSVATLPGDRIAYRLADAFILAVEVVDTIVGPTACP
jgi:hypothetical protein